MRFAILRKSYMIPLHLLPLPLCSLLVLLSAGARFSYAASGLAEDHGTRARSAAERSLMEGDIDHAISTLARVVATNPNDGQAYLLLCRSFYAEERPDEAIGTCEKSVEMLQGSSRAEDWMGRAYGMKAALAGPIAGYVLARKVKTAFEKAVELDPTDGEAVNDLSEFYIAAPIIVGGGQDKAEELADHVQAHLPQQARRIRALAAEKRKDYETAEREFKAAVSVANHPDAWADLGAFYRRRSLNDKAVEALKQCLVVDHVKDASVVDAASLLDTMHREPQLAEVALRQYLVSSAKSDAAPAIKVHVMLGKRMAETGNKTEATIEFQRALDLASSYAPAKQALQEL